MTIRFARLDDVPALVKGGARMHALTRFRRLDYNGAKVAQAFTDLIVKGRHKYVFLVAQNAEGCVVGALIGVLEQHIFSDRPVASVMHFDVLPEARMGGYAVRLLKAFERWAENRNVAEIAFGINSGEELEKLSRFAGRMGYRKAGEHFVRERL